MVLSPYKDHTVLEGFVVLQARQIFNILPWELFGDVWRTITVITLRVIFDRMPYEAGYRNNGVQLLSLQRLLRVISVRMPYEAGYRSNGRATNRVS